jgi:hypothetical protein
MRRIVSATLLAVMIGTGSSTAQDAISFTLASDNNIRHHTFKYQEPYFLKSRSHRIKNIVVFDDRSGLAYTSDSIFRTDDAGATWSEMSAAGNAGRTIAAVLFNDKQTGLVLLSDENYYFELAGTSDGGLSWTRRAVVLEDASFYELDPTDVVLKGDPARSMEISARIPTSSNFSGRVVYRSDDGGNSWQFSSRSIALNDEGEAPSVRRTGNWSVETSGSCAYFKSGCVQETILSISGKNATPPALKELSSQAREDAKRSAHKNQMFAAPPGGSTRISLNRGFDKCQAGSVAQMQIWWDNSFHFDSNIYFSGRARACPTQPFTGNPAWIDQVSAMGWGLIPTVVGYQSPCSVSTTPHKHSIDPVVAEQQGRGEADIAVTDATNIGLTAGSVLYYDMERYDEPVPATGCRTATTAFLKGWTERIHELGYVSGVYGSPTNAVADWIGITPVSSRMDAVWLARWDNVMSVWTYNSPSPIVPTNVWNNHQRIKQWQSPHNETWGGVTFNIDGNISDGPVAGVPFARNKVADFDGDGKTDISVFRPSTGQWFIAGSLGPSYNFYQFGIGSDILTPGDYDGDGKTDFAVFRPDDSTWYFRTKGAYTTRQYGEPGDIPAQADYDGNGRTDIALFRPSTSVWYIAYSDSLNSFGQVQFGQNGDRPAVADYDGDGKADIAVWRPSDSTWYVQGTAGSYFTATWGVSTDIPAPGDYDADGKADFAVFRGATGTWYLLMSTDGMLIQQFGVDGDLPTTGDYDGDGRYDIAVFRPSNGTWYMSQSQGLYVVREFGVSEDKPIPTAYLPR